MWLLHLSGDSCKWVGWTLSLVVWLLLYPSLFYGFGSVWLTVGWWILCRCCKTLAEPTFGGLRKWVLQSHFPHSFVSYGRACVSTVPELSQYVWIWWRLCLVLSTRNCYLETTSHVMSCHVLRTSESVLLACRVDSLHRSLEAHGLRSNINSSRVAYSSDSAPLECHQLFVKKSHVMLWQRNLGWSWGVLMFIMVWNEVSRHGYDQLCLN